MNALAAHQRDPDRTRQILLQAAFDEIYLHGFQGTSLDRILKDTGVTKGALYHHFRNKNELGYAVVDEVIKPMVVTEWVTALAETDDPLEAIVRIIEVQHEKHHENAALCGCPLNNLAQEMSPIDEGFRTRIKSLFDSWRRGIAGALREGQARGKVREDINVDHVSTFVVASIEGTIGLGKNAQSHEIMESSLGGLRLFLDSLRPVAAVQA